MPIRFRIDDTTEFAGVMSERKLRAIDRVVLKDSLAWWHKNLARKHFTRAAYNEYKDEYSRFKKKKRGAPLVRRGRLIQKALAARQRNSIRGTFRNASMTVRYGRPGRFTPEAIETAIFIEMEKRSINYNQARSRVYSKAGYGARQSRAMNRMMAAVSDGDLQLAVQQEIKNRRKVMREMAQRKRSRL